MSGEEIKLQVGDEVKKAAGGKAYIRGGGEEGNRFCRDQG